MNRYRVWVQVPGQEKAQVAICADEAGARRALALILEKHPVDGVKWFIYQSVEELIASGEM